jgi:hypothetical protein
VKELTRLAGEDTHVAFERAHGDDLERVVRSALDAVASVFETGTEALADWRERRVKVLARVAALREALERSGVDEDVRRRTRELVALLGPGGSRNAGR